MLAQKLKAPRIGGAGRLAAFHIVERNHQHPRGPLEKQRGMTLHRCGKTVCPCLFGRQAVTRHDFLHKTTRNCANYVSSTLPQLFPSQSRRANAINTVAHPRLLALPKITCSAVVCTDERVHALLTTTDFRAWSIRGCTPLRPQCHKALPPPAMPIHKSRAQVLRVGRRCASIRLECNRR